MILEIALAGVSAATAAVACARVIRRVQSLENERVGEVPVRPWHKASADCALCGQAWSILTVKYSGGFLNWACAVCGGKYKTPRKGA